MKESGVGIYLKTPTREIIEQSFQLGFKASNNEAAYEAMVAGLRLTMSLGARRLKIMIDFQFVVNQVSGEYVARDTKMASYLELVNALRSQFESCEGHQVLR